MREFEAVLSNLVIEVGGLYAAALGGVDGLMIEGFSRAQSIDLESAVAEHAGLLRATRERYAATMSTPSVHEWFAVGDPIVGYVRPISEEYFLLCVGSPEVNLGQLRLKASQAAEILKGVLG
jgi:predicted regulator of Ras-like GTPase activity (Roadblock/LC7/MglB family)